MVTLAATSVDVLFYTAHGVDYVSRWLVRGFATTVVIYAFSEISGAHINPAITLGFALRRVFSPMAVLPYWIAQLAGAFTASALLLALFGRDALRYGASHPGPDFSQTSAVVCEAVLTYIVMLTILLTGRQKAEIGKESANGGRLSRCGVRFLCRSHQRRFDEPGPFNGATSSRGQLRYYLDLRRWTHCRCGVGGFSPLPVVW